MLEDLVEFFEDAHRTGLADQPKTSALFEFFDPFHHVDDFFLYDVGNYFFQVFHTLVLQSFVSAAARSNPNATVENALKCQGTLSVRILSVRFGTGWLLNERSRAEPNDYIFLNRRRKPIDQKEFAERHFWPALTVLKIRQRDFYATRGTFISVMISHNENSKRLAEYCGTSLAMIEKSYGKWIGGTEAFGLAALQAAKPKPEPKPFVTEESEVEEIPVVGLVRGGGFEPPRHFWH
jgi:hypothetical protein